jgi:two-component system response regulator AtoC
VTTVLIVDDDPSVLYALSEVLGDRGHRVLQASNGHEALRLVDDADAVLTDLAMPEMDGLELLRTLNARDPQLPVVLVTAHGSERVAVQAVKAGAFDYLAKPFDIDEIAVVVQRAVETRLLRQRNRRFAAERALGRRVVAESPALRRMLAAAERVAARDVTVLVRGETGTGKEFVAQFLHAHSPRAEKPLVRFNCAAIPTELAEAELFGHVKGAFTGANANRRGFFAEADGGTLVLDEVGEIGLGVQAKLLRALQEGEIQPVGSGRVEKVDVRVVASTNKDLAAAVKDGTFREDLYYRLAVVELTVPPLRDRPEDIPALAQEFGRRYGEKFGLGALGVEEPVIEWLVRQPWPGNVRQLENMFARLTALSGGGSIGMADLRAALGDAMVAPAPLPPVGQTGPIPTVASGSGEMEAVHDPSAGPSLKEQMEAFERGLITRTLDGSGGNQSEAARRLGVSRVSLIDRMKKYGLQRPRRESTPT